QAIHSAGRDLLALINQILDLSKVEAGRVEINREPVRVTDVREHVERTFRGLALQQGIAFTVEVDPGVPEVVQSDGQLLEQILKNLLSNAFKFTDHGEVGLSIEVAPPGTSF